MKSKCSSEESITTPATLDNSLPPKRNSKIAVTFEINCLKQDK